VICEFSQNTDEWLNWRRGKVGASDAPIIMGISPYDTPYDLWERKLQLVEEKKKTFQMKRGSDLENEALNCFNLKMGFSMLPQVLKCKSCEWMIASLDGYDCQSAVEIKCPGKADHQLAVNGKIPDKYYPQLQHQLLVAELEMMWYCSYDGSSIEIVVVRSDKEYQEKLIEKEKEFYRCLKEFIPPEMSDRDFLKREDPFWIELSERYLNVKRQLKQLESEEKYLRESLVKACDGKSCLGNGIKLNRVARKGSIKYDDIPNLIGVDLESYRASPTVSYRITETKEVI